MERQTKPNSPTETKPSPTIANTPPQYLMARRENWMEGPSGAVGAAVPE